MQISCLRDKGYPEDRRGDDDGLRSVTTECDSGFGILGKGMLVITDPTDLCCEVSVT